MKKIVFINYSYGIGSTGTLIQEITERCKKNTDYETITVCKKAIAKERIYIIGNRFSHLFAGLYSRVTGYQGSACWLETLTLIHYLQSEKPDIVHLHNLHGNYINIKILLDWLSTSDCKVIWTLHDCWGFTGNCSHYTEAMCDKWRSKEECRNCKQVRRYPPSWYFDRGHAMLVNKRAMYEAIADKLNFVTVSDWLREEAEQSICGSYPITRIYNWIDLNVFVPKTEQTRELIRRKFKKKVLLFTAVSIWSREKGLEKLKKLAKQLNPDIGIVAAGRCKESSTDNLFFIGSISDREKMAEYYSAADIYINFSKEETFGLTTAEALACGTPAIVMNSTANPEILGECGIALDEDSPQKIMEAITCVINEKKKFSSKKCRERVERLFSPRNIEQYLALYDKVTTA